MFKIIILALILITYLQEANDTLASDLVVSPSAELNTGSFEQAVDRRVTTLKNFLEARKSPLSPYAFEFVYYADLYDIDWRLVAAISGVESGFGVKVPKNSYNAYGWANGNFRFGSWKESIEIVSKTLRQKYYDKGATTITQISRRYAPPSKSWAWKVKFFMDKIDPIPVEFDL